MARSTSPFAASLPVLVAAVGLPSAGWSQVAADPRVDSVFAEWDRPDSPGCALGVYRDGRIAYARGYGMADLERFVMPAIRLGWTGTGTVHP